MCKCLYCYRPLGEGETDFHPACAKKFFGTKDVPALDYTLEQIDALASQVIKEQTSLTGVQPKLSLHLGKHEGSQRLTIVGLWGGFILKPQTALYAQLPEVEDLTMHLAEVARIEVVPHTLMRMADGSLCYLTRRIDRTKKGEKIAMEDFCQLTERQTEYKYKSSCEAVGKAILRYSSVPKMDVVDFMEVLLFSWITGNNDMHLKNFSLYEPMEQRVQSRTSSDSSESRQGKTEGQPKEGKPRLSPAYDLLNAVIVNPRDKEELALTLNGKKSNIKAEDFVKASVTLGIPENVTTNLFAKYKSLEPKFVECINASFLTEELKTAYVELIRKRLCRL